jgi:hypothetical protein
MINILASIIIEDASGNAAAWVSAVASIIAFLIAAVALVFMSRQLNISKEENESRLNEIERKIQQERIERNEREADRNREMIFKRAENLWEIEKEFNSSKEMAAAFYILEYSPSDMLKQRCKIGDYIKEQYNVASIDKFEIMNSELEWAFDKLFKYLAYICYLKRNGIISEDEFGVYNYRMKVIKKSKKARDYFAELKHVAESVGADNTSFSYLIDHINSI